MKFKSAVDNWYYMIVVGVVISLLVSVLPSVLAGHISLIYALTITILSVGLPIWLLCSTYYTVLNGMLIIKSGPFVWKVKIDEIVSAKPSRNMISSPALSLNRIELSYSHGKRILVSPEDSEEFLKAIGHSCQVT